MDESAIAVLIGLILAFLPLAIAAVILVGIFLLVGAAIGLVVLMEKPVSCWFCAISVAVSVLVIVPLAVVSIAASIRAPDLWQAAADYVYIFSAALITPAVIFFVICQLADLE